MPATHVPQVKLPAVSGSSGRLVIESPKKDDSQAEYPGRVFADETLDYAAAMKQFVAESAAKTASATSKDIAVEPTGLQFEKQKLRKEEAALRAARRQVRQHRKQADVAWQALKAQRKANQQHRKAQIAAPLVAARLGEVGKRHLNSSSNSVINVRQNSNNERLKINNGESSESSFVNGQKHCR